MKVSRRSFLIGSAATIASAGLTSVISGCDGSTKLTKSGIDPKKFETPGLISLNMGLENTYTSEQPTKLYVITNKNGAELCVTNAGARIVSLMIPDKNGELKDMVLGFDNIKQYVNYKEMPKNFFGPIVGRYANRIGKAKFKLDGKEYKLNVNENQNLLHGGDFGFHTQVFTESSFDPNSHVCLSLTSPDGDMGFPGELKLDVTYTLNDNNTLSIFYKATTDKATPVNLSSHCFWDVSGDPNEPITKDHLFICSKQTTPVDDELIPTGEILDTKIGDPFDFFGENAEYFKQGKLMGKDENADNQQLKYGKGYDHNFVILSQEAAKIAGVDFNGKFEISNDGSSELKDKARLLAKVYSEVSGITMQIISTEPGLQFFGSQDMDGSIVGKNGKKFTKHAGFVLEPQHFPDSPNHKNFPNTILYPGETFKSKSEYKFTT